MLVAGVCSPIFKFPFSLQPHLFLMHMQHVHISHMFTLLRRCGLCCYATLTSYLQEEFSVFPPCLFVLLTIILVAEYYFIEWRTYFGSAANIFSFHNHFFFGLLSDTYPPPPFYLFVLGFWLDCITGENGTSHTLELSGGRIWPSM